MPFNINNFKQSGLQYGGARPSLFQVTLTPPPILGIDTTSMSKFTFTCQAAELPPAVRGVIEIPYFGRTIKVAGQAQFPDWQVNVQVDEDFSTRSAFELWSNAINSLEGNVRQSGLTDEELKADAQVVQYGKDGSVLRAYTIVGAWPSNVGPIQLGWDQANQIESFAVVFQLDYWLPADEGSNPYSSVNQYGDNT